MSLVSQSYTDDKYHSRHSGPLTLRTVLSPLFYDVPWASDVGIVFWMYQLQLNTLTVFTFG